MTSVRRNAACAALVVVAVLAGGFAIGRASAPGPDRSPGHAAASPSAVDIGFAQDMAAHHEQAVLMSSLAVTRGGTAVRAIGESILAGQSQEVGLLRGWLRLWGAPGAGERPMAWMGSHMTAGMPMSHDVLMPGMASPADLDRLYALTGRRFDVLFLQLMIRHHEGGLLMTHAVEQLHPLGSTLTAAQGISSEQLEEIGTMRALLAAAGAKPLAAPTL